MAWYLTDQFPPVVRQKAQPAWLSLRPLPLALGKPMISIAAIYVPFIIVIVVFTDMVFGSHFVISSVFVGKITLFCYIFSVFVNGRCIISNLYPEHFPAHPERRGKTMNQRKINKDVQP
jgi:hypothetical protein